MLFLSVCVCVCECVCVWVYKGSYFASALPLIPELLCLSLLFWGEKKFLNSSADRVDVDRLFEEILKAQKDLCRVRTTHEVTTNTIGKAQRNQTTAALAWHTFLREHAVAEV